MCNFFFKFGIIPGIFPLNQTDSYPFPKITIKKSLLVNYQMILVIFFGYQNRLQTSYPSFINPYSLKSLCPGVANVWEPLYCRKNWGLPYGAWLIFGSYSQLVHQESKKKKNRKRLVCVRVCLCVHVFNIHKKNVPV